MDLITPTDRFRVEIETGSFTGGLYELEQVTIYRVVDVDNGQIRLELHGALSASLDKDTSSWGTVVYSGVVGVTPTEDARGVVVRYHDGREEFILLV